MLALMASFLDLRKKGRAGVSELDKDIHYIDENLNRAADGEAEHPAVNIATIADAE
jgi:hypothetical protein